MSSDHHQHYVPVKYLNGFSFLSKSGKVNQVHVYNKEKAPYITRVNDIAAENHYFSHITVKSNGSINYADKRDEILSKIENETWDCFNKLLTKLNNPNLEDGIIINLSDQSKKIISRFVAVHFPRPSKLREIIQNVTTNASFSLGFESNQNTYEFKLWDKASGYSELDKKNTDKYMHWETIIKLTESLEKDLFNYIWHFESIRPKIRNLAFITSDFPVIVNPLGLQQVLFPLDKHHLIRFVHPSFSPYQHDMLMNYVDSNIVNKCNQLQLSNCHKQAYSSNPFNV